MQTGKASYNVLKRSILRPIGTRRAEVLLGAGIGNDSSVLQTMEGGVFLVSTNLAVMYGKTVPRCLLNRICGDQAASGAEMISVQAGLIVPQTMEEPELAIWMKRLDRECEILNVQISGGHTMISDAAEKPILSLTGIGAPKYFSPEPAAPDMDLIVTKYIGMEGTAVLAIEREKSLSSRYTYEFIYGAKQMIEYLSTVPEAAAAGQHGVTAMHNIAEGGILGALWEMADGAGVGLEVEMGKIPIRQETVEICEFFEINPYQLISGGAMLMAAKDGHRAVRQLELAGIPAVIIGRTTDRRDRVIIHGEERRYLDRPKADEIYKIIK